ncbi:tRNA epoxyqueuosine(34) reductase QueG [Glaciecola sp. XM2]|uniref:tRNA epoxyqueuosine(34) reductase QueG n=1 Tax=Glaciecola sp. XM2 TaxID=1914931 RepID=UPI001BDEE352|nr:tRNA epoxyqueuosine(34) reductase QueG [Glaciecola sp. XM2]MBT1449971.1 tRNA epoxyqueuosine(34) reductase QueG [Glaciecola sp. XM2]
MSLEPSLDYSSLANNIKAWGKSLGFQQVGITDVDVSQHHQAFLDWLEKGYHGQMSFFERNIEKRLHPEQLVENTLRVISVRMNYLPEDAHFASNLEQSDSAYISRYALGRDYHKLMRKRLKQLGEKILSHCDTLEFRPFVDSAPVLEHAFAEKAGIGWTGKHSLTINKDAGSWFFLGELFVNIPLPTDEPIEEGCGTCAACISICPTQAIIEPYKIDANRCISYLTIEHQGAIPEEFREPMGNRIYGCDDCQLICPYNRQAPTTQEQDFSPRAALKNLSLIDAFNWTSDMFLKATEGTAIRRIGIERWRRNVSVAMGNAPYSNEIIACLKAALEQEHSPVLKEHYQWALRQQEQKGASMPGDAIPIIDISRQQARLIRSIKKGLPRDA